MREILRVGSELLFYYYLAGGISYLCLLIVAFAARPRHLFRQSSIRLQSLKRSPFLPPVSIIMPARNEELTVVESIRALLALDYPEFDVIVVNDGSTDGTLNKLSEVFDLRSARMLYVPEVRTAEVRAIYLSKKEPRLTVVDKVSHGSKADAVNAGLNAASGAFVCIIDADSILENDALLRMMSAVYTDTVAVVAAGGIIRVLNGCAVSGGTVERVMLPRRKIEVLQVIEYLRAFLIGRVGWSKLDMLPIISGAFGLFNTNLLREVGGLNPSATGEDIDLVIRLHGHLLKKRSAYRIAFVPDPTCWTEVPADLKSLGSQRSRWQRGLIETLWKTRQMLFRPTYGRVGFVLLPYLWLFEAFEPIIEAFGYICIAMSFVFGVGDRAFLFQILLLGYGFSAQISIASVVLEEMTYRRYQSWREVARLIVFSFLEFPYHQLHVWWRIRGTWQYIRGTGLWQPIKRTARGASGASSRHIPT